MNIILSSSNSQPIYEQIATQIKAMIMSGELKTKDPLPSIRGLAKSLHVSVITAQFRGMGLLKPWRAKEPLSPPRIRILSGRSISV